MTHIVEVKIPNIGDFSDVPIIEILVKPGEKVEVETPLVVLESDKATLDVPSPEAGVVQSILVTLHDKVSEGSPILTLIVEDAVIVGDSPQPTAASPTPIPAPATKADKEPSQEQSVQPKEQPTAHKLDHLAYATPMVRKAARLAGVDLSQVKGSGAHGRILWQDVDQILTGAGQTVGSDSGLGLLPWPSLDFSAHGPTHREPLSRIRKISGANLHRNWVKIPHVTSHDLADITDTEAFRVEMNAELATSGDKLTILPFLVKAAVHALKDHPQFNASLDGDDLIMKDYYHIGVAADTPHGLMVPVVRDADQKSIRDIAQEMKRLAKAAREGKVKPEEIQGGCFTISSLGGVGGTYFTPIINAPEVAIMGICKAYWSQYSDDGQNWSSRLMLPLSLSWDHRVIDGVSAARFNASFAAYVRDIRRMVV